MIFVKETRPRIVKENPDMGALIVMKHVGSQWQNLTDKDRQYFQDKADLDKLRYLKEMKEFYDEVQRIGDRMGTVRSSDGQYNVAATNQEDEEQSTPVQAEEEVLPASKSKKGPGKDSDLTVKEDSARNTAKAVQ